VTLPLKHSCPRANALVYFGLEPMKKVLKSAPQTELIASGLVALADPPARGGTSPKPPIPTKESDVKHPTDPPKDKDPFYGFEGETGEDDEANFLTSFLYSLSLITTVGKNREPLLKGKDQYS
jgi:hypothetical protein